MMRLWFLALVVCFLAASIEGRNSLRSLQEDAPVASPTDDREGEPVDVVVEEPETPPPTAAADVDAPAPTPADDGGEESPTADDVYDDAGDGGDDAGDDEDTEPTAAPSQPDDADEGGADGDGDDGGDDTEGGGAPEDKIPQTTPGAGGQGGGDDTEGTQAPDDETPEPTPDAGDDAGDDQGDGNEDTVPESTPMPSIASVEVTAEPTQAPTEEPDDTIAESPTGDGDGDEDDFDEWDNYTPPTEPPVVYKPPNEDEDPIKNESNGTQPWIREGETPEEMIHDRNVLIAVGALCGFGILLMIITAHQMVENPDGCCASVCRLITGCTCCILRTICFPCRACCGGGGRKRRARQHQMLDNGNYTHDLELS